jgi:hypothetical protein
MDFLGAEKHIDEKKTALMLGAFMDRIVGRDANFVPIDVNV